MQKIEQVKPESVHNRDEVLGDHFINGIRDTILRRELKKSVNERPALTFLDVRMIAMQWIDDIPASPTLQTVNKISAVNNAEIDDLKAIVKEQQKTISELTEAVKKLTEHQLQAGRPTLPQDGSRQPLQCFRCGAYGHMARACDQPSHGKGLWRVQRSWSVSARITSPLWFGKLASVSVESQTQAAGKERGSSKKQATKTVGHCPTVTICIGGKEVTCLLDTGSMVTTVTEDFFRKNLQDKCDMMNSSFYCLKAANGIDLPYIGFISTDITVGDEMITDVGIFVTKTPSDAGTKRRRENIPGLLGMNVLQKSSDIAGLFGRSCLAVDRVKAEIAKKTFSRAKFVRSADDRTLLPANSVTTVMTNGGPTSSDDPVMIQHLVYNEHLPRGVMVVDTLTCKKNGLYPVHVANLGQADVWLNKGVRVGMIKEVDVICDSDSDTCIEEMGVNEIFVHRQEVVCFRLQTNQQHYT